MKTKYIDVFKSCFLFCVYFYGFINITSDLLLNTISISLICLLTSVSFIFAFRIPQPNQTFINLICGIDPALVSDDFGESENSPMKVVAHRGAGLDAPENSIVSFQMCALKGCTGVEFDVRLTADDVPIVFHDETFERMVGVRAFIRSMTWDEISEINISAQHPLRDKFQDTRIATLDEVVKECLFLKQKMFIDIKECDMKIVPIILDLFDRYPNLEAHALCSSFYPHIIYMIRRQNPQIVCSLAWRPHFFAYQSYGIPYGPGLPRSTNFFKHLFLTTFDAIYAWALPRFIYFFVGISAILLHKDAISGQIVNEWKRKDVRVFAWTVNQMSEKQYYSRVLKITYLTDTLNGESHVHATKTRR